MPGDKGSREKPPAGDIVIADAEYERRVAEVRRSDPRLGLSGLSGKKSPDAPQDNQQKGLRVGDQLRPKASPVTESPRPATKPAKPSYGTVKEAHIDSGKPTQDSIKETERGRVKEVIRTFLADFIVRINFKLDFADKDGQYLLTLYRQDNTGKDNPEPFEGTENGIMYKLRAYMEAEKF